MNCKTLLLGCSIAMLSSNLYAAESCIHDNNKFRCLEYVKNYDGDTITFNIPHLHNIIGKKINISLIDVKTPRLTSSDECAKKTAKKAKSYVKKLLKDGKHIEVIDVRRAKNFGLQGRILIDGTDLSKKLLNNNLAVTTKEYTKTNWCKISKQS